jgi:monoamine oxidase
MKRRTAIKHIGFGLSAGLAVPAWLSACGSKDPGPEIDYDGVVGIIGAGAAGMYVADILQTRGVRVVIYEASDRLGGRVRSIRQFEDNPLNSDFPTELGAERILGTDGLWAKMVQQLGIPAVEFTAQAGDCFFLDGAYFKKADALNDPDFAAAYGFMTNLKTYAGDNVSVQQAIQSAGLNPRVHAILNAWLANRHGTSSDRLGIQALAQSASLLTRNSNEIILGSNPMQDVLSSRFSKITSNIQFGHVVKKVDYSGDKIRIQGEQKTTTATTPFSDEVDRLIVTVPVSVLQDGDIAFTPALPADKGNALLRLGMDTTLRVVLEFRLNFWNVDTALIYGGATVPEYFNAGVGRSQFSKTLSLTICGSKAETLAPLGDDMVPVILDELDTVFKGKATENIRVDSDSKKIVSVIHNWKNDPYIRGGVSYVKPGGTNDDRIALGQPVDKKIFFAGEATDGSGDSGTINGALLSAERVAAEVVESIVTPLI